MYVTLTYPVGFRMSDSHFIKVSLKLTLGQVHVHLWEIPHESIYRKASAVFNHTITS